MSNKLTFVYRTLPVLSVKFYLCRFEEMQLTGIWPCCCCCCHDEPVRRWLYGGTDVPKRWRIPPDSGSPGTHLWCQSNHRSNAGILLPILGRATVNVQLSRPHMWTGRGFNLANKCLVGSCGAESVELQLVDCSLCLSRISSRYPWAGLTTTPFQIPFCSSSWFAGLCHIFKFLLPFL